MPTESSSAPSAEGPSSPARQLSRLWAKGEQPDAADFLSRFPDLAPDQLADVLRVDQDQRWRLGEQPDAESYLKRFPFLASDAVNALVLIWGEVLTRRDRGESPALEEYQRRFPTHAEALALQFALQEALESSPSTCSEVTAPAGQETDELLWVDVPGYEVRGVLGRGGMGVVYKAWQPELKRLVALKMLRSGDQAGEEERRRFRTEAEAAARLQHPNIVQVYQVGEHRGQLYIALEFCAEGSLAARLDGSPWPARAAAELVETLARAMHHAHQKGVIHRDLKPANVLLAACGLGNSTKPQAAFEPKITDFGLARQLNEVGQTTTGAILGTPAYMAPEQARGQTRDVGPATDIYALGATLYELLTGRPPFQATETMETLWQVLRQDPVPPRRLQPRAPRDLETICLKCLDKQPSRRYATAQGLADDLRHFLNQEPIRARPIGPLRQMLMWARRRPAAASLVFGLALLLLLVSSGASLWAVIANRDALAARAKAQRDEEELYALRMSKIRKDWEDGETENLRTLLDFYQPGGAVDLRGFEWYYWYRLAHAEQQVLRWRENLRAVSHTPDGRALVLGCTDNTIAVLDALTGREFLVLRGHTRPVVSADFSPNCHLVASSSLDATVRVWDARTGAQLCALEMPDAIAYGVSFSPDGGTLATSAWNREVKLWDTATGRHLRTITLQQYSSPVVCFSPDGLHLAVGGVNTNVEIYDVQTGAAEHALEGHDEVVTAICFSPDGARLASGTLDGTLKLWDWRRGQQEELNLYPRNSTVQTLCFSPDGAYLASGHNSAIRLWDATTGKLSRTLLGHTRAIADMSFSPDGTQLISLGDWDNTLRVWDVRSRREPALVFPGHNCEPGCLAFSPDGTRLAAASRWDVKVRDAHTGEEQLTLRGHEDTVTSVCFSPDGTCLVSGDLAGKVKVRDACTGRELRSFLGHEESVRSIAFHPAGAWAATASDDGTVRLWDAGTGRELLCLPSEGAYKGHPLSIRSIAFSPDGRLLAAAGWLAVRGAPSQVKVWEVPQGVPPAGNPLQCRELRNFNLNEKTLDLCDVCFSPDSQRLAICGNGIQVWDVRSGVAGMTLQGHKSPVQRVCWSPDGRRLASASGDRTVKLWDMRTGEEVLSLSHYHWVWSVCFSPDGTRLASCAGDQGKPGEVMIWESSGP